MPDDLYAGFAERYDLFPSRFTLHDEDAIGFFRRLFTENGVRTLLDCACGTGRDLLLFYSLGCEVTGSDVSPAMLAKARANLAKHGLSAPLHQADFRNLPDCFAQRFDALACLSTAIGHALDDEAALQAFRSMRGALRDGGILVLEQGISDRQWAERPRFVLVEDTSEVTRLFALDYLDYLGGTGGRDVRYNVLDVFHRSHEVKEWSAVLHVLLRDDQERLLRAAGFREVTFYGGYGFEPYDRRASERLITVARK